MSKLQPNTFNIIFFYYVLNFTGQIIHSELWMCYWCASRTVLQRNFSNLPKAPSLKVWNYRSDIKFKVFIIRVFSFFLLPSHWRVSRGLCFPSSTSFLPGISSISVSHFSEAKKCINNEDFHLVWWMMSCGLFSLFLDWKLLSHLDWRIPLLLSNYK